MMQITDTNRDDRLSKMLYFASAYFDMKIKSHIDKRSHDDLFDGDDSTEFIGLHRPIITLDEVKIDGVSVLSDVVVYKEEGRLYYAGGFASGRQNIQIAYHSGYVNEDGDTVIPDPVQLCVMQIASVLQQRIGKEMVGSLATFNGDSFQYLDKEMPESVVSVINDYARADRLLQSNKSFIQVV
jgi:hypothetical protein